MWVTYAMKLLTNKFVIMGLILVGLVVYYEIGNASYRSSILKLKETLVTEKEAYVELDGKYITSQINLSSAVKLNNSNTEICQDYKNDVNASKVATSLLLKDKDIQIQRLIITIDKLRKLPKLETKDFITIKDCKIWKVKKGAKDVNDTNIKDMSSIGF
jgi:hypothetical protein